MVHNPPHPKTLEEKIDFWSDLEMGRKIKSLAFLFTSSVVDKKCICTALCNADDAKSLQQTLVQASASYLTHLQLSWKIPPYPYICKRLFILACQKTENLLVYRIYWLQSFFNTFVLDMTGCNE